MKAVHRKSAASALHLGESMKSAISARQPRTVCRDYPRDLEWPGRGHSSVSSFLIWSTAPCCAGRLIIKSRHVPPFQDIFDVHAKVSDGFFGLGAARQELDRSEIASRMDPVAWILARFADVLAKGCTQMAAFMCVSTALPWSFLFAACSQVRECPRATLHRRCLWPSG